MKKLSDKNINQKNNLIIGIFKKNQKYMKKLIEKCK